MGNCWYCHWGWPEPVARIYQEAVDRLGGNDSPLEFGPSHIVWSDENFGDDSVQWCIANCDKPSDQLSVGQTAIVRESLEKLLAVPESIRDCEPADYDGENPERFPPPVGLEMVRV